MSATPEPLLIAIPDALRAISVGQRTLYGLIRRGDVDVVHIGRRTLVTVVSLEQCAERHASREDGGAGSLISDVTPRFPRTIAGRSCPTSSRASTICRDWRTETSGR